MIATAIALNINPKNAPREEPSDFAFDVPKLNLLNKENKALMTDPTAFLRAPNASLKASIPGCAAFLKLSQLFLIVEKITPTMPIIATKAKAQGLKEARIVFITLMGLSIFLNKPNALDNTLMNLSGIKLVRLPLTLDSGPDIPLWTILLVWTILLALGLKLTGFLQ